MKHIYRIWFVILTLTFPLLSGKHLNAQLVDYKSGFVYPFEFHHLQLTVEFDPLRSAVRGVATWQMSPKEENLEQIRLTAIRTDVKTVRINERKVEHFIEADTLIIEPASALTPNIRFKLEIVYESEPVLGLHRTRMGSYWSALVPGARADLFPMVTHPSIQVPTDIRVIVPNEWKGFATGFMLASTLMPEEKRLYHWRSETPVPITDITVSGGNFEFSEATRGTKKIRVYNDFAAFSEQERRSILEKAGLMLDKIEAFLDFKYPYEGLNLLLVEDHMWDTRQFAATYGILAQNGGDPDEQLFRILISQFFGSWHRTERLDQSELMLSFQAVVYHHLKDSLNLGNLRGPDDFPPISNDSWNIYSHSQWRNAVLQTDNLLRNRVYEKGSIQRIVRSRSGVYDPKMYSTLAQVQESSFQLVQKNYRAPEVQNFSISYSFEESLNRYEIEILPKEVYPEAFLPITLRQFSNGSISEVELLVSSRGDRIHVTSAGLIENIYALNTNPLLQFKEYKPASFWLYQLRRDSDSSRRIEAAEGFARVKDDPDIQLIMGDLIQNEPDVVVKSVLVESLGVLLNGATGTHQRFINLLNAPEREVRFKALEALARYRSNPAVQREVFRIISSSQDMTFVNTAIEVYFSIVDPGEFFSVARSLLVEDLNELNFTETIVPLIVKTERGKTFAPNLMQYLEEIYPYSLRVLTLKTLKELEISASYWKDVLPDLVSDSDARIRFASVELYNRFSEELAMEFLSDRLLNEYDVRVVERLQQYLAE